jgi:nucleoside-diphosphate-sugar epimerase
VLIVGCGYIGQRVAVLLQATGCRVTGSVRGTASHVALNEAGIDARLLDLDRPAVDHDGVSGYDALFYFAPPQTEGDRDLRMQTFLQLLDTGAPPRRMVYISTSAVYGDCQGAWITESQPVNPATARGRRRLDAEQQLCKWCKVHGTQWVLLRVPGIYGPGKLPLERLRKGTPVLNEADSPYTNRIHGDDLAGICVAALFSAHADEIYNVSDGHPSNMTDYFFRVADAAGLSRPPVVDRNEAGRVLTKGMLSFLNDSRRMRNDKLLAQLGVSLKYPDLDAGLKSCFKD